MHLAARYGRVHVLRWLLWEAEMPALERSSNGALALHYAAARGCLDCVKLLVESSTELSANTQMDNDVTPVYLAAQEGHLEVLKFLVTEAGGSLYVRAKDGMAPVHAAAQMGCLACLKWMVTEQGVDPNLRDGDGATPLHFAASRGHVDTVRWLLRHGARLALDKFGKSPINDAAENQHMECLNILVQHGATPEVGRHACCKAAEPTPLRLAEPQPKETGRLEEARKTSRNLSEDSRDSSWGTPDCKCAEPFFLHPPPTQHQTPDGLYINPAHSVASSTDPFYLHNPRDLVYNRVKDLFEPSANPGLAVKVEVHSSSSGAGSDENLSSSDLSERSADPENDYEEIYQSREEKPARRRSRDSGSHSRTGSTSSSSNGHQVVVTSAPPPAPQPPPQEEPSMTASTESGVSSGSPSDLGHSEEECEKTRVSHRHSLPHLQPTGIANNNSRALKRVVSEPGSMCPPPPPPPPPAEEGTPSPSRSPSPADSTPEVVEETAEFVTTVKRPESPGSTADNSEQRPAPNLVNKQMVLPFIPPRFPSSSADSNSLIKPSEYLRSLGGSRLKLPDCVDLATPPCSKTEPPAAAAPPPPPLPEPTDTATRKQQQQQPLGAISIQDLNSVQLRRTDKMLAAKTLSAPPRHNGDQPFMIQKEDLIAELKLSKDITGIKKLKVERAKVEEQQEKEMFTEITRQLTANSFVEKIPEKDATGNPIPAWKRQMMAKKAAERARKELEEQMLKEAEEKRLQSIPPWKRQLLAKKEDDSRKTNLYTPRVVDDKKMKPSKPEEVLRQQLPSNSDSAPMAEEGNKENKTPEQPVSTPMQTTMKDNDSEESAQIIPWRAQLRKTNSKLSLLE
ncbi:espin isoform X2 [Periplaneta americana]|uniref:espin isoform X2 n=1 Tax=Periplaneta americana TaxID=6978 RepID=UPI0037E80285